MLPRSRRHPLALALLVALTAHCGSSVAPSDGSANDTGADVATDTPAPDAPVSDAADVTDVTLPDVRDGEGIDVQPTDAPTPDAPAPDAPPTNSGDCRTDADCFSGRCVEITPGGFRECYSPPNIATACQQPGLDQCNCNGAVCPDGQQCLASAPVPFCGGVVMENYNQCAQDQCASDADCTSSPGQICAPAGTLDRQVRACVNAACKLDSDCRAEPGGICAPVRDACCSAESGLFCVYPSNGCRSNSDCGSGTYCEINYSTGEARCVTGSPICPA